MKTELTKRPKAVLSKSIKGSKGLSDEQVLMLMFAKDMVKKALEIHSMKKMMHDQTELIKETLKRYAAIDEEDKSNPEI